MSEDKKVEKEKSPEGRTSVGEHSQDKTCFQQRKTKFEGSGDELKDHIFDCSDSRQVDKSPATLKEVINYVRKIINKARILPRH
eukprot:10546267-Ditylum_brightwellii.AAC.1